jgi:pimeloyl-ACP methyl ester carboxylesterase
MRARSVFVSMLTCVVVGALSLPGGAATADPAGATCSETDVPVTTLTATGTMHGTLCLPAGPVPGTVMVLVPGATYNSSYWDFPFEPETYSYTRAMNAAGYATFALDRLGTGKSTRPLSAQVTSLTQADAIHQVVRSLRSGAGMGTSFHQVILTGHSLGSAISVLEAATYHDVNALVVTGMTHRLNAVNLTELFALDLVPTPLDPVLSSRGLDAGYLTTAQGRRYAAFHAPGVVDPRVIAVDEATKDVFSTTEAPDAVGIAILGPYSGLIDVPVFIAMGERDALFCGFVLAVCSTSGVLNNERPYYGSAPSVDAFVLPTAGHDVNLSPLAPQLHAAVIAWADATLRP